MFNRRTLIVVGVLGSVVLLVHGWFLYEHRESWRAAREACDIFERFRSAVIEGDLETARSMVTHVALDELQVDDVTSVPPGLCIGKATVTYCGVDVRDRFDWLKSDFRRTFKHHRWARAKTASKVCFAGGYCLLNELPTLRFAFDLAV